MKVSSNSNYRPSDPPPVGSQQFGGRNGASAPLGAPAPGPGQPGGGQPGGGRPGTGNHEAGRHDSGQAWTDEYGQVRYGGGQYTDYGQYLDSMGQPQQFETAQYGSAPHGSGPLSYGQGAYSQPMTYGISGAPFVVMTKPNSLAVWAMWMGIIGIAGGCVCFLLSMIPIIGYFFSLLAMFLWIAPLLAVIFGHVALAKIRRSGELGRGQAITGLVLGYIAIALGVLFLVIAVGLLGLGLLAFGVFG